MNWQTWEDVRDWINKRLHNKTPQDVIAYVEGNVNDMASAKELLIKIILVLIFIVMNRNWRLGDEGE